MINRHSAHGKTTAVAVILMIAALSALVTPMRGKDSKAAHVVASDSSGFVRTSMLITSPSQPIYSVFGHAALRMQCPSAGLDYCFTFNMESGTWGVVKFFFGDTKAGFEAVPTTEYLNKISGEHRQVKQYELNLTLDEKRELWRALDEEMMRGPYRRFNMFRENCVGMAMLKVESIMFNEQFVYSNVPKQMYYKNGDLLKYMSRRSPWAQFVFLAFSGSEADNCWIFEDKLSPEMLPRILQSSVIRNDSMGTVRKAVSSVSTVLEGRTFDDGEPLPLLFTPLGVASLLLVVALLLTVCAHFQHCQTASFVFSRTIFVFQSVVGVLLLYATAVSGLFGSTWNWLLIPFNPIPLVLWLFCRKKKWYSRCLSMYVVVLMAFLCIVPWVTCQLIAAHYVLVATFLVCAAGRVKKTPKDP